ncbi:MAG: hypothetical protein H6934_09885 [Burkholderiaceae bacterium]|nr:hypothetical protein [Burkholderiaceae bacterium]
MLKNKLRAGGVHLLISATVVAVVVVLAWRVWYPGYLSIAAGMLTMIGILAAVDIVLGPVCTFIVYRPGKQSLRFDLAVIAGVQLLALAYGVHAIYVARPAYIVFAIDRFEVVSAAELEPRQLELASPEFRGLPRTGPLLVAARLPGDREERNALLLSETLYGAGLSQMPRYYVAYREERERGLAKSSSIDQLEKFNDATAIERALAGIGRPRDTLRYFPMTAKDRDLSVIVDARSGNVLGVVDLRPWG